MWWLIAPAVGVVGKLIYDAVTEGDKPPSSYTPSPNQTLIMNLMRLRHSLIGEHAPKIAILGQPGAGKSSLLKKVTHGKVQPPPVIGTETDATTWADNSSCHLVSHYEATKFVDVPGYDTEAHPTHAFRMFFPFEQFDAFLFVFKGKINSSDEEMFDYARKTSKPICVVRAFADGLDTHEFAQAQADLTQRLRLDHRVDFVHYSNRTGQGVDKVRDFCIQIS
jgi:GTP-binding protein EngB required for normal cell division